MQLTPREPFDNHDSASFLHERKLPDNVDAPGFVNPREKEGPMACETDPAVGAP